MLRRVFLPLLVLIALATHAGVLASPLQSFAIIASTEVDESSLTRETLSFIFQRKQLVWKNGKRIQPVNLPPANPLRRVFSQCVLGREPDAMEDYWREMYFHGVLPPHVLESETAVMLFVDSTPGAIGYVTMCSPHMHSKVLLTIGEPTNCPRHPATCS